MQNNFVLQLSSRLKLLRACRTQAEMAKELGVNQQTYARWELGDRQPKLQDLCEIVLHFGVSADWLLGIKETSHMDTTDWHAKYQDTSQQLSRINKALGYILKGAHELQVILEEGVKT